MSEEIKEILDIFTKYKDDWYSVEYKLKPKQCVILYDYITNLQEENENLKLSLKNRIKYSEDLDEKTLRIEKAIEYITKDDIFYYGDELYDSYQEIVNILKGDDNNDNLFNVER